MRKYDRLKERYYETDFIDDADQKTKVEGRIPEDFPNWAPEEAYQAYIDAFYDGDETSWNLMDFLYSYEGRYDSAQSFLEESLSRSSVKELLNILSESLDLEELGSKIYSFYEEEVSKAMDELNADYDSSDFIGDEDSSEEDSLDKDPLEEAIVSEFCVIDSEGFKGYDDYAKKYIEILIDKGNLYIDEIIQNLKEDFEEPDIWDKLIDYYFGTNDYIFYDGFVFQQ